MGQATRSGADESTPTDDPAFETAQSVWQSHRRWVAAIVLAHKPREAELEDLLQDIAMKLVENIDTLRDRSAVRPWLRTVAVNAARTAGRRQSVRRAARSTLARTVPHECVDPDTAGQHATRDEGHRALDAVRSLPEEYREPMFLRAVRGMSYRQIADALGLPVTTIETRLVRGRRKLREMLAPNDDARAANHPLPREVQP